MDGFLLSYFVLVVIALLAFLGFYGVVIYLIDDFIPRISRSKTKQNLDFDENDKGTSGDKRIHEILIES